MLAPEVLYPLEMYEQMFGFGIKSGKNDVVYQQQYNSMKFEKRMLTLSNNIDDYDKEDDRLEFGWNVTKHN